MKKYFTNLIALVFLFFQSLSFAEPLENIQSSEELREWYEHNPPKGEVPIERKEMIDSIVENSAYFFESEDMREWLLSDLEEMLRLENENDFSPKHYSDNAKFIREYFILFEKDGLGPSESIQISAEIAEFCPELFKDYILRLSKFEKIVLSREALEKEYLEAYEMIPEDNQFLRNAFLSSVILEHTKKVSDGYYTDMHNYCSHITLFGKVWKKRQALEISPKQAAKGKLPGLPGDTLYIDSLHFSIISTIGPSFEAFIGYEKNPGQFQVLNDWDPVDTSEMLVIEQMEIFRALAEEIEMELKPSE